MLAFIFELLSRSKRFKKIKPAIRPMLAVGSCAAILAAASGYFLSQEGGYDLVLVERHRQLGIGTALFTVFTYIFISYSSRIHKAYRRSARLFVFLPLMLLLVYTGHLGGSLTHGEDFLTAPSQILTEQSPIESQQVSNVIEANIYGDVIKPLLDQHCSSCHSAKKQKGNLRLDEIDWIRKGGKHGAVLVAGDPSESELYKRLVLPIEEDHHMPPRGKKQLSSSEVELLREWILQGSEFDKKIKDLKEPKEMEKAYLATVNQQAASLIPESPVEPVNPEIVTTLKAQGIIVVPMAANSNYVSVTCLEPQKITDEETKLLEPLSSQLLELKLSRSFITNETLKRIKGCKKLKKLFLDHTKISDDGIGALIDTKLVYLNLVGTPLTDQCVDNLGSIKTLSNVFLFGTKISEQGISKLHELNPTLTIDKGGYTLDQLPSDTIEFKRTEY